MSASNIDGVSERLVAECTAHQVADAITRSFEGYVTPVRANARWYERRFRPEDLDPFSSRLYFRGDKPVAVLLVARRGWTSRVAAMGVAPEVRGRGFGKHVMQGAIREAVSRGDRSLLLEVFEQNTPAVNLYTGLGFEPLRTLVGYQRGSGGAAARTADTLSELDPLAFARVVAREGDAGLPWMLAAETLSAFTSPARAYHLDNHAYALIGDPDARRIELGALVVPRDDRRKGWGSRLMHALQAALPGRSWSIPAIVPQEMAPAFFTESGWKPQDMRQLEMSLDLSSRERTTTENATNA